MDNVAAEVASAVPVVLVSGGAARSVANVCALQGDRSKGGAREDELGTLPLVAQLSGALVNLAVPSAGGEWAVIGPSLMQAAQTLSTDLPPDQAERFLARVAMAAAYGETSTNLLQPFFLLIILPVMGAGVRIQARDLMGYLLIPFLFTTLLIAGCVSWIPL